MITINKTQTKDLKALKIFLKKYKLEESLFIERLEDTVIILDRSQILGFGAFVIQGDIGVIDVAILSEEVLWPSMGDGMIKTMLNTLDLRGVKKAYLLSDDAHAKTIEKIGLGASLVCPEDALKGVDAPWLLKDLNKVFETDLPDFFDHACHSAK